MKIISILSLYLLLIATSSAFSQEIPQPAGIPVLVPGRTMEMGAPKTYEDSAEFTKAFTEFYPLVKSNKSVKEEAETYFKNISRTFKMQGIDSAEAAKAAFKGLEEDAFEKVYFDTYRRNMSAKELKKYTEFIKTPEGKHIVEIWPNLQRAPSETVMYIARAINLNLNPIRQAAMEKMQKEHPPQKNAMSPGRVMIPGGIPAPSGMTPVTSPTKETVDTKKQVKTKTKK